jgi:hypothetical protein
MLLFSLLKTAFPVDPLGVSNAFSTFPNKCIASANGIPCFCRLEIENG